MHDIAFHLVAHASCKLSMVDLEQSSSFSPLPGGRMQNASSILAQWCLDCRADWIQKNILPHAQMTEIELPSSPVKAFKPSFWAVCKHKAQDIASAHVFGALHCYWRKPLKRRANPALGVDSDKQQNRPPVAQSEAGLMSSHTRMHQRYT